MLIYIQVVFIYFHIGKANGYTSSFLGFSVYVSNTTNILPETLCFKDSIFTLDTIPSIFTTTCHMNGQYIIYHNERLPGVTYSDKYSKYAYSDLCELEAWGKILFSLLKERGHNYVQIYFFFIVNNVLVMHFYCPTEL